MFSPFIEQNVKQLMPEVGSVSVTGSLKTELFLKTKTKTKRKKKQTKTKTTFIKSVFLSLKVVSLITLSAHPHLSLVLSQCAFLKFILLYMYEYFAHLCLCTTGMPDAIRGQERESDPLGLEL